MSTVNGGLRLLVGLLFVQSASAVTLQYSDQVPLEQQQYLNSDIENLKNLVPVDSDGELKRIMKLGAVNSTEMDKWLTSRVRFVVEESFKINGALVIEKEKANYPNAKVDATLGSAAEQKEAKSEVKVVMSNLGAGIYGMGKANQILIGAMISGIGTLVVNSPRVGLLQVGEGLFMPLAKEWPKDRIKDELHSLRRLATLFHEARHSDGHAGSLSFSHVICPIGHNYFGKPACDKSANGAYRISSLVTKAFSTACKTCSLKEKELLGILGLDQMNRILVPVKRSANVNDLCNLAKANGKTPAFCANPEIETHHEFDDSPEEVKL